MIELDDMVLTEFKRSSSLTIMLISSLVLAVALTPFEVPAAAANNFTFKLLTSSAFLRPLMDEPGKKGSEKPLFAIISDCLPQLQLLSEARTLLEAGSSARQKDTLADKQKISVNPQIIAMEEDSTGTGMLHNNTR
jgi:hypothetical protein